MQKHYKASIYLTKLTYERITALCEATSENRSRLVARLVDEAFMKQNDDNVRRGTSDGK